MSFWLRLLRALGFQAPNERTYYLDEELAKSLQILAEQEQRTEGEVAANLITDAFSRRLAFQDLLQRWQSLSPREQQVAMMICRNYTTGEMADELVVSPYTVKAHVRKILIKFDVHSRGELRLLLADFDFWESGSS
jgi:DNA-binding CsgD family transcriptional regulator